MNKKFFVSCGEMSGDLHLSYIVDEMLKIDPKTEFYGVIGDKSIKSGVKEISNIDNIAVMGLSEAFKKYSYLKNKAKEYIKFIKENDIKNIIFVDYGGFNLKFFKLIKKEKINVKTYYYIPPKVWIWGKYRLKTLKQFDEIITIFPWEKSFYQENNIDVQYFGNPFVDKYKFRNKSGDKILLLPGSRKQEINSILPVMLDYVKNHKDKKFILRLASKNHEELINENLDEYPNIEKTYEKLENIVDEVEFSIATSGTVTFELALMNVPTIVVYKSSSLNVFIAKKIIKLKYMTLTNIALDKEVFPELLQEEVNINNIDNKITKMDIKSVTNDLINHRKLMGEHGVLRQISEFILKGAE